MTPEERAKQIYDIAHEALWLADALPLIASAIRDAESDALERAAVHFDKHSNNWGIFREEVAEQLRALRHPAKGET